MRRSVFATVFVSFTLLAFTSCSLVEIPAEELASRNPTTTESERPESETTSNSEPEDGESGAFLVPVVHLTSSLEDVSLDRLSRTPNVAVSREVDEGVEGLINDPDLELFETHEGALRHISRTPGAVGLVPWEEVDARVKTLSVDGENSFRPGVEVSEDYPLEIGDAGEPDTEKLRRVVIGGDMVLDRGLPYAVFEQGRGIKFPLDGGHAAITSRASEPSEYSEFGEIHHFTAERRGEAGAVRKYLNGTDLTLANLESPLLANSVYHPEGTTFHGDLRLLPILEDAGIDGVALANNHVLDAGEEGLAETTAHLDEAGISHAGAGRNLAAARKPMIFDLGGTKVGVLNYQNVPSYEWAWATKDSPGTAPLVERMLREDVKRLEKRVDAVIVMPHWGEEYTATPEPGQVELARAAVDAGADLVVGGHAHWAKGIEVYEKAPVFYGVGNFLFDQVWSEETSTGIFAEITMYEGLVIQAKPVPFIVLDYGQPNFLTPKGGGRRALDTIYSASLGPEFKARGTEEIPRATRIKRR